MVIPSLIRKAFTDGEINAWGDGSAVRDFIHARDVAEGMIFAVENKITQPMNLGSGDGVTIKHVTEIVAGLANVEIKWDVSKPSGDARRVFDMERAKSLGFTQKISIEDGIKETVEWYLNNKEIANKSVDTFKSLKS
jgi:GDP-L-fucose synthase